MIDLKAASIIFFSGFSTMKQATTIASFNSHDFSIRGSVQNVMDTP